MPSAPFGAPLSLSSTTGTATASATGTTWTTTTTASSTRLDIDDDCDLDNDADLHAINGALYRDDGINAMDSDIDGDGLENDVDWDDDNDGIADIFDPDDGNCGVLDNDLNDNFQTPFYPINDGGFLDGSLDSQGYSDNTSDYWAMVYQHNPFSEMVLNYNGYDGTTNPPTAGTIPEFYWYYYARWNNYNGGNEWDIDSDGDSLVNGLDTDQDGDGMPDWWDQDEGNDGVLDVNDIKMGGSIDMSTCGHTVGQFGNGFVCGYAYALAWHMPLNGVNAQFGAPYSTRPDANVDQGAVVPPTNTEVGCTPGAQGGCYLYDFGGDGAPESGISYTDIVNNRDAYITWLGLLIGLWQWQSDNGPEADFPDELGADFDDNDVDGDTDGDFTNDTVDIDDDYDAVYDWFDVDDDNDGIWDLLRSGQQRRLRRRQRPTEFQLLQRTELRRQRRRRQRPRRRRRRVLPSSLGFGCPEPRAPPTRLLRRGQRQRRRSRR